MNKQEALKWCAENMKEWGIWPIHSGCFPDWHWLSPGNGERHLMKASVECITKTEWQAAREEYLAEQRSQGGPLKPQWNGEGLPPVGVECEVSNCGGEWQRVGILYMGSEMCVTRQPYGEQHYHLNSTKFRPIRTDRDKAIEFLLDPGDPCGYSYVECRDDAEAIIDALDAGKIPGYGKLEK